MKHRKSISLGLMAVYLLTTLLSVYLSLTCICSHERGERHACDTSCRHTPGESADSFRMDPSCRCLHHYLADNTNLYVDSNRDRSHAPSLQLLQILLPTEIRTEYEEQTTERIPAPRSVPLHSHIITPRPLRGPPALV